MKPEKFSSQAPKPIDFAEALKRKQQLKAKAAPPKSPAPASEKKPASN